jgi:hypothetical protein
MDRGARDGLLGDIAMVANALSSVDDQVRRNAPVGAVQGQSDNAKRLIDALLNRVSGVGGAEGSGKRRGMEWRREWKENEKGSRRGRRSKQEGAEASPLLR